MKKNLCILATSLLVFAIGCFDFSGKLSQRRDELNKQKTALQSEVIAAKQLFTEREQAKQTLNQTENEIEQIRMFVQQREEKK